ncbi:MAG: hypothetical protein ABFD66_11560 [Smithella sp.]
MPYSESQLVGLATVFRSKTAPHLFPGYALDEIIISVLVVERVRGPCAEVGFQMETHKSPGTRWKGMGSSRG